MSTSHLCPCPACNRHVKIDAGVCPFCETALPESSCNARPPSPARPRLSRAARLLAGATLVGASACSSTEAMTTPAYGGPFPVDASPDSGTGGAAGSDATTGTGGAPSNDASEERTVDAAYGAPVTIDSGTGG